jgi:hypothetical protein
MSRTLTGAPSQVMKAIFATKRRITVAVLLAVGIVLGAGLFAYLTQGEDAAKVLKLDGRGRGVAC